MSRAESASPDQTSDLDPMPHFISVSGITFVSAPPFIGKTALIAGVLARIRDGLDVFGHPTRKPPFIGVVSSDHNWRQEQHWYTKAGWPDIPAYALQDDPTFNWSKISRDDLDVTDVFTACLNRLGELHLGAPLPPGSLVFFDPLHLFVQGNFINYRTTAAGISKLKQVLHRRQIAVIATAHTGKQKAKDEYKRPEDRLLGSTAFAGFSSAMIYLERNEDDPKKYLLGLHAHERPIELIELERDEQGLFKLAPTPQQVAAELQTGEEYALLAAFPPHPQCVNTHTLLEYALNNLQLPTRTTERRLLTLRQQGLIESPARGIYRRASTLGQS